MEGYLYLDLDGNLVRKDKTYIDTINPRFFIDNSHIIVKKWAFNTEDRTNMVNMFKAFKDMSIEKEMVLGFIKDIGFNIDSLKRNEDTV